MINNPAIIELKKLMKKNEINKSQLALRVFVPASRVSQILKEQRRFTIETDIKLCKLFNLKPLTFYNMQLNYELKQAQTKYNNQINQIISL